MFSRPLAFLLLALGCVTAAAGGAYLATRNNATESVAVSQPVTAPAPDAVASAAPGPQPVAETEAAVTGAKPTAKNDEPAARGVKAEAEPAAAPAGRRSEPAAQTPAAPARQAANTPRSNTPGRSVPANGITHPQPEIQAAPVQPQPDPSAAGAQKPAVEPAKPFEPQPESARVPQFEELILPASSVIGLQLDTPLSSERARVEDRVEARVSRDVMAAGRVAIPAGSRLIGTVTEVDKGGKVKAAAQIGIRFHTLVLADGNQVSIRTDPISRSGESPAAGSAKKIGGGAILGGIMGGGKGAAIGAATGAGGGTAAVMAGDRAAVNVPAGTFMNATLSSPATITVERRE